LRYGIAQLQFALFQSPQLQAVNVGCFRQASYRVVKVTVFLAQFKQARFVSRNLIAIQKHGILPIRLAFDGVAEWICSF